jgi:hypothetical protein
MPQQSINALDRRLYSRNNDGIANSVSSSNEQTIMVTDLISEGPIAGLVNGGNGIFLNGDSLQSSEQSSFTPPDGMTITLTTNSTTATINPGGNVFNALKGENGTKYLMVYDIYSTSVTASDLTAPTATQVFMFNGGSGGAITTIPIGGKATLTRTAGDTMAANWAHDTTHASKTIVTKPADGTRFASLKMSKSGHTIIGGLTDVDTSGAQTAKFTWGGGLSWTQLMTEEDMASGVVHTLQIGAFVEIASISGNTITLAANPGFGNGTTKYAFGITKAVMDNSAEDAETDKLEEKYENSGWSFNTGTLNQPALPTIEGVGTSSVALTAPSGQLEKNTQRVINASGAQGSEIDEVKILINYPSGIYLQSNSSGNVYPAGVGYKIEVAPDTGGTEEFITIPGPSGATYEGVPVWKHSGQFKSAVTFEMRISLLEFKPFRGIKIRITRLTKSDGADNSGSSKRNGGITPGLTHAKTRHKGTYVSSISSVVGIIKEQLNFPYSSIANVSFSSKSFSSPPTRTYLCQGMKVLVPTNYVTRESNDGLNALYTRNASGAITSNNQLWNGGFQDEKVYTDNPAWVFYDILTNNRYGLGDYLRSTDIDKYSLYKISKYCDELVPDGKGGTEPRFRANIYLTKATDAFKVLKDMATVFRGILYWSNSQFTPVMDEKKEPVYTFTRANIIDGQFNFESTGDKTRVNQISVDWNNPDAEYKIEPLLVEDRENQIRTGKIKSEKAVAFGCTSEGQAIRYGRWKLWTAINQTEIVNFKTSVNAAFIAPGDIINIQDEADFKIPFSGRVSSATTSNITIDRTISSHFAGGYNYTIAVVLPKRTVLLNQDTATVALVAGGSEVLTRGDEVTSASIGGTATTLLDSNEDTTKQRIESAEDTSGNLLHLQYVEETVIEERVLTTASTTNADGRDTIPIASAFSVLPTSGAMWAIKQVSTSTNIPTLSSYKQYKVMNITEESEGALGIVAVEYHPGKFDAVDSEFTTAVIDPLYPPETSTDIPAPIGVRILKTPDPSKGGEEVIIEWDAPLATSTSGISTEYEHVSGYRVFHTFGDQQEGSDIKSGEEVASWRRYLRFDQVSDGIHSVGIQTLAGNKSSSKTVAQIEVLDSFSGAYPRINGLVKGGYSTSDVAMVNNGSDKGFIKFGTTSYAAAPFRDITIAKRNTQVDSNTYALSCTSLAHANWPNQQDGVDLGYLMMDFSALDAASGSANALKLVALKTHSTTYGGQIEYWYDGTKFINNAASIWATLGTCSMITNSRKVVGTGFAALEIGTVLTIGNDYAAKVALVQSNTVMYVDRPWGQTTSSSEAISKQELEIDYEEDFLIAPVAYNASNTTYTLGGANNAMSFLQITPELESTGKSVLIASNVSSLSYDAAETQTTNIPSGGILLTATALGYTNPEFRFTGAGLNTTSGSAETGFTAGSNGARTFQIHNQSDIAYSAAALNYVVTVREALDPDNPNTNKSSAFSISKLKDGAAGNASALIYIYKMSVNTPTVPGDMTSPVFPNNMTVSMSTGKLVAATGYTLSSTGHIFSGGTATGWFTSPTDTGLSGGKTWVSAASVSSSGSTDTIARTEWTDPIQFSGTDGVSSAVAELYKLTNSSTAPVDPSATLTYTFADGTIKNPGGDESAADGSTTGFGGWITTASSPTTSLKYLWKITAPAIATGATDAIASSDWAGAILASQFGETGATGKSVRITAPQYFVKYNAQGNVITSGQFAFTANTTGFVGTPSYAWTLNSASVGSGTTYNYSKPTTYTASPGGSAGDIIQCTVTEALTGLTALDVQGVARLKEGVVTAYLTNEAHTITAAADGTVSSSVLGSSSVPLGEMKVFDGTTELTSGVTYTCSLQTAGPSVTNGYADNLGINLPSTGTSNTTGTYFLNQINAGWTAANTFADFRLRATITATGDTIDKVFSVSKALPGIAGGAGKQTFVGTLFYGSGIADTDNNGSPNSPPASLTTPASGFFTFDGVSFSNFSDIGAGSTQWSFTSPTFSPTNSSNQKLYYYACSVNATENDARNGTTSGTGGTLSFGTAHIIHNFSGIVAFTDLSTSNPTQTIINGNNITTGRIQGIAGASASNQPVYGVDSDGQFASTGTHFDLVDGRIRSPQFFIDGSGMGINLSDSTKTSASITLGTGVSIDGGATPKITIKETISGVVKTRVVIGKLS